MSWRKVGAYYTERIDEVLQFYKMKHIDIKEKVQCCGCNACGDICAQKAIAFKTDIEGFWYPEVDEAKCTDCGLCEKVCPIIHIDELKKNDLPQSVCYAAENKNLEVIFDSTSGGLFSALADRMYRDKGYVGGAIFNEDFSVREYISNDKEDLPKLRSSKYLQSNAEGFYREIKSLLAKGEKVLVCGTPCQMSALRAYLRKDYENIIIVDFICRGVNSPKVNRKYLDSFEERYGSKVVYSKAKSKEYGWRNLTHKVILANGEVHYETKDNNNFTKGYLHTNAYCRPSCYDCKFKGFPRIADITIGDFWGVEKVAPSMEKNLGTSVVMLNSKKGLAFFELIRSRINSIEVPFESIIAGNPALTQSIAAPLVDRNRFFEDVDRMTFVQLAEKYIVNSRPNGSSMQHKIGSLFKQIKQVGKLIRLICKTTQGSPRALYQFIRYNSIREILSQNVIIPAPYVAFEVCKGGKIVKRGISVLGFKKVKSSKLETRIYIGRNAVLEFWGRNIVSYGSCIEVHDNAKLIFKENSTCNTSCTFVCQEYMELGEDAKLGRNVVIRDNNGSHYMNRDGYKNSRPVIVGDKAWLTESCTLLPGAKIGQGAIIGAQAVVYSHIKPFSLAMGNPARVVDEDILWKC